MILQRDSLTFHDCLFSPNVFTQVSHGILHLHDLLIVVDQQPMQNEQT